MLFFKKKNQNEDSANISKIEYETVELNENEIMPIAVDNLIDTTSYRAEQIFKHNLKLLEKKILESGKQDKYYLIREDDKFPENMQWDVSGKNSFELTYFPFVKELKELVATEKLKGVSINTNNDLGFEMPVFVDQKELNIEVSKLGKDFAKVYMPSGYRSTKHFTLNTPLEITGDYNAIEAERNYIVLDDIKNFLDSGYGYTISYRDCFLDVSHEPLKISDKGIILVEEGKYNKVITEEIKAQLGNRRVIKYRGDIAIAIDMLLTQEGVMPSTVGAKYLEYNQDLNNIISKSVVDLAKENNLEVNRPHGGNDLETHYTAHYDGLINPQEEYIEKLVVFLRNEFPNCADIITSDSIKKGRSLIRVIRTSHPEVSNDKILQVIEKFNLEMKKEEKEFKEKRKNEVSNLTDDMKTLFKTSIKLAQDFYYNRKSFDLTDNERQEIDNEILTFLHDESSKKQYEASLRLNSILRKKYDDISTASMNSLEEYESKKEK